MKGTGDANFGQIAIEPKRTSASSWWIDQPQEGFTVLAAQAMKAAVPIDPSAADQQIQLMARRQQVLSALIGWRQAKRTVGVCHANVVSRN
jgi:hypothetical protein